MTIQTAERQYSTHSSRRVAWLARYLDARSYLEIGVFEGITFHDVNIERKVAVDPRFRFDVKQFGRPGRIDYYEMTSDKYFCDVAKGEKFDIIFIDGLHTFQQTLRDFLNSMTCAHDRTVWLIDDVFPSDVYSALPNSRDAHHFRKRAGGSSLAWHGDVYKLVFFIHDFMPSLSYTTISSAGNPQSLVWREARKNFSPIWNSAEAIERLGYFDLLKQQELMNLKPEDEALRLLTG